MLTTGSRIVNLFTSLLALRVIVEPCDPGGCPPPRLKAQDGVSAAPGRRRPARRAAGLVGAEGANRTRWACRVSTHQLLTLAWTLTHTHTHTHGLSHVPIADVRARAPQLRAFSTCHSISIAQLTGIPAWIAVFARTAEQRRRPLPRPPSRSLSLSLSPQGQSIRENLSTISLSNKRKSFFGPKYRNC